MSENGSHISDWESVTSVRFAELAKYLGMQVFAKPIGIFVEDATRAVMLPGINLVGSARYGRWSKPDVSKGHDLDWDSVWQWKECCTAFYAPIRGQASVLYTPADIRAWMALVSTGKPFLGPTVVNGMFGTESRLVKDAPGYQESDFVRTGTRERLDSSFGLIR